MVTRDRVVATVAREGAQPVASALPERGDMPAEDEPIEAQLERARAERAAYRTVLDEAVRRQPVDAAWRADTERDLAASIRALEAADVRVDGLECRATLCRVELSHASADGQQQFLERIAGAPGFRLRGKAHLEYGAGMTGARTFIYLARTDDGLAPDKR